MTAIALLLAADNVILYPPAGADELGWELPGTDPSWAGIGNLQLAPGISDPRAETGGGYGPHAPARVESGTLYLPADATPADGACTALLRATRGGAAVSGLREVRDPAGGSLTCWACTAMRDAQLDAAGG